MTRILSKPCQLEDFDVHVLQPMSVADDWEDESPTRLGELHPAGPFGGEYFVPGFVEFYF